MIPHTPLNRHILVVVGEEPHTKAGLVSPAFDKESRDNEIIGAVTTLGGLNIESPALLFEAVGEIASALAKLDYTVPSPVASTYVGETPVSFQVLPDDYGVAEEPDEKEDVGAPPNDMLARLFGEEDAAVMIRVHDRSVGISGSLDDMAALFGDPEALEPVVIRSVAHLFDMAVPVVEEEDDDDDIDFFVVMSPYDAADNVIKILDAADNVVLSLIEAEEGDDLVGYRMTVPADEAGDALANVLAIGGGISISRAV